MDLDQTLLWFALAGGAVTFFTGLRTWRAGDRVYLACGALILAVTGGVYLLAPGLAGTVGAITWAILVLLPNLLSRVAARAAGRRKHAWAVRLTRVMYVLHPSASVRQLLRDRRAALDLFEGRFIEAEAAFRAAAPKAGPERHAAELSVLRLRGDWEGTLAYFDAHVSEDEAARFPLLLHSYLRALGELGRRRELIATYGRFAPKLVGATRAAQRVGAWLFLFAFAGEREIVDRLFKRQLEGHAEDLADLWKLTAELAAGHALDEGAAARLAASPDAAVRAMMKRRRENAALLTAEAIEPRDEAILAGARKALEQEEQFGDATAGKHRPYAVYAFILLSLVGFVVELARATRLGSFDTTDDRLLRDVGAFHSGDIWDGEWWRLATYMFLHAGWIHISMNLFSLYLFGPFVERVLGHARFAVLYLLTGLVGSGTLLVFHEWLETAIVGEVGRLFVPAIAVGASGCVMGVIGATIAILLRAWIKDRAQVARSRLTLLVAMIGVQTYIDLTQVQISFKAHAAGLVSGILLGFVLLGRPAKPARP